MRRHARTLLQDSQPTLAAFTDYILCHTDNNTRLSNVCSLVGSTLQLPLQRHISSPATAAAVAGLKSESGTARRFYKKTSVVHVPDEGGWGVLLDQRRLKTPVKTPLVVPSLPLAMAIAAEWEYQESTLIRPYTMPLTALTSTALDQPRRAKDTIELMLRLCEHDSLCMRHEEESLAQRQTELADPILLWLEKQFQAPPRVTTSLYGTPQLDLLLNNINNYLKGLDSWHLVAVETLSAACKSIMLGIALAEGKVTVQDAISLLRVEEDQQIAKWGLVEGGHDIDIADIRTRLAAPVVFLRLASMK